MRRNYSRTAEAGGRTTHSESWRAEIPQISSPKSSCPGDSPPRTSYGAPKIGHASTRLTDLSSAGIASRLTVVPCAGTACRSPWETERRLEERLVRYAAVDSQSDEARRARRAPGGSWALGMLATSSGDRCAGRSVDRLRRGTGHDTGDDGAYSPHDRVPRARRHRAQFNATGVKPMVHRRYAGERDRAPDAPDVGCHRQSVPIWPRKVGDDIVTASGTTLLGADDKAAAIVRPWRGTCSSIPMCRTGPSGCLHAGRGDRPRRRSRPAGGPRRPSRLHTRRCRARRDRLRDLLGRQGRGAVKGVSIHPGHAKDKLVNALHLAAKIVDTLPQVTRTPETTDGREGFIHLYEMPAPRRGLCSASSCATSSSTGSPPRRAAPAGGRGGGGDRAAREIT